MKGSHVNDLLSDYMEGLLDQHQIEKVKTHIIFCNVCRNELRDLELNREKMLALPSNPLPEGFEDKILRRTRSALADRTTETESPHVHLNFQRFFTMKGVAVAAMGILVIVGIWDLLPVKTISLLEKIKTERPMPQGAPLRKDKRRDLDRLSKDSALIETPQKPSVRGLAHLEMQQSGNREQALRSRAPSTIALGAPKGTVESQVKAQPGVPLYSVNSANPSIKTLITNEPRAGGIQKKEMGPSFDEGALDKKFPSENLGLAAAKKLSDEPVYKQQEEAEINKSGEKISLPSTKTETKLSQSRSWRASGSMSGIIEPLQIVIKSPSEWIQIWTRHSLGIVNKQPPTQIDFKVSDVVAIFAGRQIKKGVVINIISIEPTVWNANTARIVNYELAQPSSSVSNTSQSESPYLFMETSKINGPTFFKNNP